MRSRDGHPVQKARKRHIGRWAYDLTEDSKDGEPAGAVEIKGRNPGRILSGTSPSR